MSSLRQNIDSLTVENYYYLFFNCNYLVNTIFNILRNEDFSDGDITAFAYR